MSQIVIATYRIREVDGRDDEIAEILTVLHRLTFFNGASVPPFDRGHWWLAYREAIPVAFAGLVPSTHVRNAGYFCRVGVLQRHWGHRLQLRLTRAMEARARRNGWSCVVSDTTGNVVSANNFIRAGYRMYWPPSPWAFPDTLYWRKDIAPGPSAHSTHSKRRWRPSCEAHFSWNDGEALYTIPQRCRPETGRRSTKGKERADHDCETETAGPANEREGGADRS